MSKINQTPYADIAACNEPHMAVLFLLDNSASTSGKPNEELKEGLRTFLKETAQDDLAMKRVDYAVMSFGTTVKTEQDFIPLNKAVETPIPELSANGSQTPMGEAIEKAIQMVRDRCRVYDQIGVPHYQPWIFMITDGKPTDSIENAKALIRQREETGRLKFFSVGVNGANMDILKSLSMRTIMATEKDQFKGIFNWLSESMCIVSASRVQDNPQLPNLPEGFADARKVPDTW